MGEPETVLITGIAGFIGSHVADALIKEGYRVFGVDDLSSGRLENVPKNAYFFKADICDFERMDTLFKETRPRFVVHHAAQVSVARSVKDPVFDAHVNILGTVGLLDLCRKYVVEKMVFASSGGALYGDVDAPAREDKKPDPKSPYGFSKWAGEQYVRYYGQEFGIGYTILRYGNVYGPRQDPYGEAGVVAVFTGRLLCGERPVINGDGEYVRDYVYVEDVAQANVAVLKKAAADAAVNVGTGIGTTVNQLFAMLVEISGIQAVPQYGPPRPGDLKTSVLDPSLAKEIFGWEPKTPLREGLKKTVEWFKGRICH
ncbi:MAG TPA: NAD-dependent epimerase/dehydratase family protein [Clostridia bacterium]|nr:NAD-dependent epimerase/dehydratase family protein [Clostridia bacterium]